MDAVCRTCLTLGELYPIFSNPNQHEHYTTVLYVTTGLKIELNDGLPQGICSNCTNLVNSTLRLRDQSHHAQQILLECGFKKTLPSAKRACKTLANIVGTIFKTNVNKRDINNKIKKEKKLDTTIDISHILERDNAELISVKNEEFGIGATRFKRKYVRRVNKKEETEKIFLNDDVTEIGNNIITENKNEYGNYEEFGNKTERGKRKYVRKVKKEERKVIVLNDDATQIGNDLNNIITGNNNAFGNKDEYGNNDKFKSNEESENKTERGKRKYVRKVKKEETKEIELNDDATEIGNNLNNIITGNNNALGNKDEYGNNDKFKSNEESENKTERGKRKYVRKVKKEETKEIELNDAATEIGNNLNNIITGNNNALGNKDEYGNNDKFKSNEETENKTERGKRKYVRKVKKEETKEIELNDDATEIGNDLNNIITGNNNAFGNKDEYGNNYKFKSNEESENNKTERGKKKYVRKVKKDETEAIVLNDDVTEVGNKRNNITEKNNEFGNDDKCRNDDKFGNNATVQKNEDIKNKGNAEKQVKTKRSNKRINPRKKKETTSSVDQINYKDLAVGTFNPKGHNKCSICMKIVSHTSFVGHVKRHYSTDFVCDQCGQRFKRKYALENHSMRRHGAERKLQCDQCHYKAVDKPQLVSHMSRVHTGARPYVCDVCSASFTDKPNIRQHIKIHYAVKNVQCDQCSAMFASRSSLSTHTAKSHRMNFKYFCYLCPRRYNKLWSARKHILRQHDIAKHLQGPIRSVKWAKTDPPPPEVSDLLIHHSLRVTLKDL